MVCDVPLHNRCPFACSVDCPQASSRLIFVTERYLWSYRPLTSQFSFCTFCADRLLCARAIAQSSFGVWETGSKGPPPPELQWAVGPDQHAQSPPPLTPALPSGLGARGPGEAIWVGLGVGAHDVRCVGEVLEGGRSVAHRSLLGSVPGGRGIWVLEEELEEGRVGLVRRPGRLCLCPPPPLQLRRGKCELGGTCESVGRGGRGLRSADFCNFAIFLQLPFARPPRVRVGVSPVQRCFSLRLRGVWLRHRNWSAIFRNFSRLGLTLRDRNSQGGGITGGSGGSWGSHSPLQSAKPTPAGSSSGITYTVGPTT